MAEKSFLWSLCIAAAYALYMYFVIMQGETLSARQIIMTLQYSLFYIGIVMAFGVCWTEYYFYDATVLAFGGRRKDTYFGGLLALLLLVVQTMLLAALLGFCAGSFTGFGGINNATFAVGVLGMLFAGSMARLLGYIMRKFGKMVYIVFIMIFAGGGSAFMAVLSSGFTASFELHVSSAFVLAGILVCVLMQAVQYLVIRKMAV